MLQRASRRLILAAVLFTVGVSAALAQAEKVYVTRTGQKYHRASCTSLRSSKIEMPLAEAAARYGACKICRPPVPTAAVTHCTGRTASVVSRLRRPCRPFNALPGHHQEGNPVLSEREGGN